jgi:hypothetical protein
MHVISSIASSTRSKRIALEIEGASVLTLREVVTRALADVGAGHRAALGPGLPSVPSASLGENGHGAPADVVLVRVKRITPQGDAILAAPVPVARELWAIVDHEPGTKHFALTLDMAAEARITRVYHPMAIAEIGDHGLLIRKVMKGLSARDVAIAFGVPCYAGPDLAEWRAPEP